MNFSVKHALSIVTKSQLRFVSLINCNARCFHPELLHTNGGEDAADIDPIYDELSKLYYFCLGKHSFFILARNMEPQEEYGGYLLKIPYGCMDSVSIMPALVDSELFVINLHTRPADVPSWVPLEIYCRSPARDYVIGQIKICWKTDFMFQHLKVGVFRVHTSTSDLLADMVWNSPSIFREEALPGAWRSDGAKGGPSEFATTAPHPSMGLYKIRGYEFYAHKDFAPETKRNEKELFFRNRGRKSDHYRGEHFSVRAQPPVDMSAPRPIVEETVQSVATDALKKHVVQFVQDYRMVETPSSCLKHGNPDGDIASWSAWMIRVRTLGLRPGMKDNVAAAGTEYRDITIIACRRTYIPPTMDTSQDIVIIFYGAANKYGSNSAVVTPQGILDTLTPASRGFLCDEIVVQTKADALLLSESDYSWFHSRLRIQPRAWRRGLEFCKSLTLLLERAGLTGLLTHPRAQILFKDTHLREDQEDPFEFAAYLAKEAVGLPDTAPPEIFEEWRRRVWRFLSWCIDGGMLPSVLTIDSLVYYYNVLIGQPRPQAKLVQIFESILYLRAPGEPYVNAPLVAKLRDERLMRKFVFNEYVMIRLIESGYLKSVLTQKADRTEYPRFLVRLLQRKTDASGGRYATRLKYSIAKQIVQLSMAFSHSTLRVIKKNKTLSVDDVGNSGPIADDVSVNIVVPTLFRMVMEDDENMQILATVSLVNYTLKNAIMKNAVMAGGILRRIVSFLGSKNNDLVRHTCALLNNCTKSEQYRQTVASFQVGPMLLNLLLPSPVPPAYRTVPILVNAVAVIGNLAIDTGLREKILDSFGRNYDGVGAVREADKSQKIPGIVMVLGDLLEQTADIDPTTAEKRDASTEHADSSDGETDANDEMEQGNISEVEPLATLYFHVVNTLKNLSVRIIDGDTSNKRCMRYVLENVFRVLKTTNSVQLQCVVLEFLYVLSFDKLLLYEMYSKFQLRTILEKMGEKNPKGLEFILKDLKRLHDKLNSS